MYIYMNIWIPFIVIFTTREKIKGFQTKHALKSCKGYEVPRLGNWVCINKFSQIFTFDAQIWTFFMFFFVKHTKYFYGLTTVLATLWIESI